MAGVRQRRKSKETKGRARPSPRIRYRGMEIDRRRVGGRRGSEKGERRERVRDTVDRR